MLMDSTRQRTRVSQTKSATVPGSPDNPIARAASLGTVLTQVGPRYLEVPWSHSKNCEGKIHDRQENKTKVHQTSQPRLQRDQTNPARNTATPNRKQETPRPLHPLTILETGPSSTGLGPTQMMQKLYDNGRDT